MNNTRWSSYHTEDFQRGESGQVGTAHGEDDECREYVLLYDSCDHPLAFIPARIRIGF